MATSRERTPRGQGDLLRERLVDAAIALIDLRGLGAVSIRAVTREAGVSPNAFYLHFESLDELVFACVERCFAQFRDALRERPAGDDPRDRLFAAGAAYVDFARAHPERYAVLFVIDGVGEHDAQNKPPSGDSAYDDLLTLVRANLPADSREDEVEMVALGIWTGLHGYVTLTASRPGQGWPEPDGFLTRMAEAWLGPTRSG